jgi:hypothetical protein
MRKTTGGKNSTQEPVVNNASKVGTTKAEIGRNKNPTAR